MPTFLTGKIYVQRSLFVESAYLLQCAFKFLRNWNAKLLYQIKIQRTLYAIFRAWWQQMLPKSK